VYPGEVAPNSTFQVTVGVEYGLHGRPDNATIRAAIYSLCRHQDEILYSCLDRKPENVYHRMTSTGCFRDAPGGWGGGPVSWPKMLRVWAGMYYDGLFGPKLAELTALGVESMPRCAHTLRISELLDQFVLRARVSARPVVSAFLIRSLGHQF